MKADGIRLVREAERRLRKQLKREPAPAAVAGPPTLLKPLPRRSMEQTPRRA
jgi:hypothetical protein